MAAQFENFKNTLFKMFMLDQAELDFGIYRIMNQKKEEISRFLNIELPKQVKKLLSENASAHTLDLQKQLEEKITQIKSLGYDPDTNPAVISLREEIAKTGSSDELENSVYSHLAIFFSRYYDGGDFISLRRYKKDVYAIPYEGEEVKLHWANADQYYIKTGEYFRNYSFKLSEGKSVEFTLKDVTTEQNNNLSQNNMERRFAIFEEEPITVEGNILHINFTYELYPKTTKQKTLIDNAYDFVKELIPAEFYELFTLHPTDKDRNRTLLQKHFTDYVARNTFDYFIHKDLHGFLTRELDFYIKNEILVIDDINSRSTEEFVSHLSVIKTIKAVGTSLIQFLSQLENFQKRLWLKKKMVVQADYCITLDRVPEELYAEICANDCQREEWVRLFAIDEIKGDSLTVEFLKENPFLVLDTAFFSKEFKQKLISSIDNLDEQCDGLMINSENFQALQLLQEKYREQIDCIYIDPPYNTKKNEFVYKDNMKHSSWMTMIHNRLSSVIQYLKNTSAVMISCDENEQSNLRLVANSIFGENNYLSEIIWQGGAKNDQKYLSISHEYIEVYLKDKIYLDSTDIRWTERKEGLDRIYAAYDKIRKQYPENYDKQTEEMKKWYKELPKSDPATRQKHYCYSESRGLFFPDNISKPANGYYYDVIHPITGKPCKKPKGGWRFIEETMESQINDDRVLFGKDENTVPCRKSFLKETEYESPNTVIYLDNRVSTKLIKDFFNDKDKFDNPKYYQLIARLLKLVGNKDNGVFFDFFAGSGTTAHAIIHLNKSDGGRRKYVMCEMGDYFSSVTIPRLNKVIYSKDWKDGKPVSREGSSHCFKYMRLEQYEDTLNNLVVSQNLMSTEGEFYEGFLLGYMLDLETKDSLFNLKWFENPFNMKLRITRNNEIKEENVDLIETFNYLIGLYVEQISYPKSGICTVEGRTRAGKKALVIWRDCTKISNEQLNDFFTKLAYSVRDSEFDVIYVNGDNNLENLRADQDTWKVVLIEQEFNKQMFNC